MTNVTEIICAHRWSPEIHTMPFEEEPTVLKICNLCHVGWNLKDPEPRIVTGKLEALE